MSSVTLHPIHTPGFRKWAGLSACDESEVVKWLNG